ncbi:MAG: hypothetical protein M0Z83_00850 [Betaproteobacteria bacterium]|nr:hypothetical protein [Betaproteobacteria bacterium]
MEKRFSATLSRSQGRSAWAVIFRHPVRVDLNTGKPGLRVRQGLGTPDEAEANELKDQLNQLLADETFWSLPAKAEAERRFHRRVTEIFYHGMEPEESDFGAIRESIIPLPISKNSDYRRALLLGTTGAGKTTLLRQLIGTDPETERFPSTSTAKTTVHETEVVLAPGSYKAVVTFFPIDEVREHLNECISEAVLSAYRGDDDGDVLRKLLMHVNQRFRFNYVLGNGPKASVLDNDEDDEDDEFVPDDETAADSIIDIDGTNALLTKTLAALRTIAARHGNQLKSELGEIDEKDQRVVDELFEEELDRSLREDDEFHRISDELMDEIELRFSLLTDGTVRRKQGWPQSWSWETEDRTSFIKTVTRFSSNHSPRFGWLLTPLVNGVRVSGEFLPDWNNGQQPKLVLLDGEGLGHTPKSVASLSTSLSRRIEATDAIVLVDNAVQPMQAAPVAAMKEMITSGSASKLLLVFTHFDEVKGDNLPNALAKEQHVLASAENVLASIGEELGPFAERSLRNRLKKEARFFVGGIDEDLDVTKKTHRRTIDQLQALLAAINAIVEKPAPVLAKPVYDRMNLVLAVKNAAESFHDAWWPRLGLDYKPGVGKEHWKRIWALSRRLSTPGRGDEYDNLKPVADLRKQLQDRLYVLLQNPIRWDPAEPIDDAHKQQVFDEIANALSVKTLDLATRRVRAERMPEWQSAFNQSGRGSSYARASIIGERIYERAAPIPDVTPSPDRNSFLHEVAAMVESVCEDVGAKLA